MRSLKEYIVEAAEAAEQPQVGDVLMIEISPEQLIETVVTEITADGFIVNLDETATMLMFNSGILLEDSNMPVAVDSTSPIHGDEVTEGGPKSWMKSVKRGLKMWDGSDHLKDIQDYIKNAPDDLLIRLSKGKNELPDPHTPRDLQIKLINRELKRRYGIKPGLSESDPHNDLNHEQTADEELEMHEAEYQGRKVPLGKPMKGDVKKSKVYVKNAKGNVVKVNFGDKNMRIKKSNPKRRKNFRARHNCKNPGPRWKARYWSCRAW